MLNLRNRDNGDSRDIRRREVADILDSDLNAYKRVFEREKDWVNLFQENIKPQTQLDLKASETAQKEAEKINDVLTEKVANIEILLDSSKIVKSIELVQGEINAYNSLTNNADFLRFYNDLMRSFSDPAVSSMTKETIKTNIRTIEPYINTMVYGLKDLLNNKFLSRYSGQALPPTERNNIPSGNTVITVLSPQDLQHLNATEQKSYNRVRKMGRLYLRRLLSSLSVYLFVQRSLFRNNYGVISPSDIENEYKNFYGSQTENTKGYIDSIVQDSTSTKGNNDALARRAQLISDDQQAPLSLDQTEALRHSIFGTPQREPVLTQQDKDELERYSVEKQAEIERLSKEAGDRIQLGQQASYIVPELPIREGEAIIPIESSIMGNNSNYNMDVEPEIPVPYYGDQLTTQNVEIQHKEIYDHLLKLAHKYYNDCLPLLNSMKPAKDLKVSIARTNTRKLKEYSVSARFDDIKYINGEDDGITEGTITDDIEKYYPIINKQNIEQQNFRKNGATPADKKIERREIYDELKKLVDDTYAIIYPKKEHIRHRIIRLAKPIYGQGKPRFSNRFSAMDYNDDRNDNYLIR